MAWASWCAIARSISESAKANDLPEEIWGELVQAIDAESAFADIKRLVVTLNDEAPKYLATR